MSETLCCPDPFGDMDRCAVCEGWGHRCPAFRSAHPERLAEVQAVYLAGYDPTRFYSGAMLAAHGEAVTARKRKGH